LLSRGLARVKKNSKTAEIFDVLMYFLFQDYLS